MWKKCYREVAETAADPVAVAGDPVAVAGDPVAVAGDPVAVAGDPVAVAGDPVVVVREVAGPSRYGKFPPEKAKNTGKSWLIFSCFKVLLKRQFGSREIRNVLAANLDSVFPASTFICGDDLSAWLYRTVLRIRKRAVPDVFFARELTSRWPLFACLCQTWCVEPLQLAALSHGP